MEQKLGHLGGFNDFAIGALAALAPSFVIQTQLYEKICLSFAAGMYTWSCPYYQQGVGLHHRIWQVALASHIGTLPIIFCELTPEQSIWIIVSYSVLKLASIYFQNINMYRLSEEVLFLSGSIALTKMFVGSEMDDCSVVDQLEILTTGIGEGEIRVGDARGNFTGF